jgi:DNA-binding beta-propeller fold protein YncE
MVLSRGEVGDVPDSSSYGIFLSYRRGDTTPYARLLQSELTGRFPDAPVFMDLDSIEPGLDFVEVIERAVDSCAVLVVLMGRQWATLADEGGQRRLDDPDDFVRSEVQTALERGVRVIPVLVDGARPVRRQELPVGLQKLARLNALELSSGRYRYDADRLFNVIQGVLAEVKERAEAERQAGEEAERVEAERKAREEAEQVEAERKAARLALERHTDDDSRTVAAAAAEILGSDKPPPTPPRLELSATAVDFGRIAYRAQSPERRIRLHNAGGGSLNARAASEAKWLKLRLEGDELVLTVDTAQVGRHEHILAVDSDGGSGSLLVQAFVEPAEQPAPEPASAPPEPSPPERAAPGAPQRTGLSSPSPAPPVTAPEPAPPSAPTMPGGGAGPGAWPARRRTWIAIAAAGAVVAAGVVSYLLLAGGHKTPSAAPPSTAPSATTPVLAPPGCTTKTARLAPPLKVHTGFVPVSTKPFDVVVTRNHFGFISHKFGPLVVVNTASFVPSTLQTVPLTDSEGEAFTHDGQYLLVSGNDGMAVFRVSDLEAGGTAPVGSLHAPRGKGAIQVVTSRNDHLAFVALQHSNEVAVFDLRKALTSGFGPADFVGRIPLKGDPTGMAAAPDARHLYVVSGLADKAIQSGMGTLAVVDMDKAAAHPKSSVVATVNAGCGPARVIASPDGKNVWVTAGGGNTLEAFSAGKLLTDPRHALIAKMRVGQIPLGLAFIDSGRRIVVANSNRDNVGGAVSGLAVIDASKALAGGHALVGTIKSGAAPRQFALEPNGKTLLVTNTGSGQLEAVNVGQLP